MRQVRRPHVEGFALDRPSWSSVVGNAWGYFLPTATCADLVRGIGWRMLAEDDSNTGYRLDDAVRAAEVAAELSDVVYTVRLEPDPAFEYVSPSVTDLVGYTPEEHYADPHLGTKLLDPRDAEILAQAAQAPIGEAVAFTVRWLAKDGRTVWTAHRCRKQLREDGSVVLYGAARDVTAEHDLAEKLAELSAQLSLVLDNTADVVGRLGADGTLLWISPSIRPVFGWDPAQIVGTRFRISAPEWRGHMERLLARAIQEHADRYSARLQVLRADGETRWAETRSTLVWDSSGELDSVVVVLRDVSREVALQQLSQRMLENSTDVVFEVDSDNTYRWVSPSVTTVLGWAPEHLVGKSAADLIHPADLARVIESRTPADASAVAAVDEFRFRQADGNYRWMSGVSRQVSDDTGQFQSRVVGLRDVQALVETRRKYQMLAENASDVVWEGSNQGVLTWLSPSVTVLLGWDMQEIVGHPIAEFIHPDDLPLLAPVREKLMRGLPSEVQVRMRTASGAYLWISALAQPVLDDSGTVIGRCGGWRNIQDEVAASTALAESEQQYRLLAENASDIVFRGDNDAVMQWISPSVTSVLGWEPQELIGHFIGEFIHPDDLPDVAEVSRNVARGTEGGYEARLRKRNGTYLWMKVDARPLLDAAGVAIGRVGSAHNVHAEVAARHAQAASDDKYRLLAENATDAVYLVSPDGTIEWISPAVERLLGWNPHSLIGTKSAELVHFEDQRTYRSMVADVEAGQATVHWEFRARQADRTYRWMSAASSPILDDDGRLTGRITTLRDIEQEVRDRQALARSEQTFRLAMAGAPQGMAVVGLHGPILQTNQMLCDLVGRDDAWLRAHHEVDIVHPDDVEDDQTVRDRLLAGESEYNIREGRLIDADGNDVWVQHSLALVRDEHDMPMFYVSQYQDISEARRLRAELQYRASHDTLTGLINREELTRRLDHHLGRTPRRPGVLALLYCDLDYFKDVNDTGGHASGDAVLQRTAEQIKSVLRDTDEVSRLGGDEFVVLLADVTDTASALDVAEKIRQAVSEPIAVDGHTMTVTLSIGVALAESDVEGHRLLRNADHALYQAKQRGRDQTVVYSTH